MTTDVKLTKPWKEWPLELPSSKDREQTSLYKQINDEKTLREMHAQIRERAFKTLGAEIKEGAVILQGGTDAEWEFYDSDTFKNDFRQEAYFRYLFQINLPDCFGVMDIPAKKTYLFVPEASDDSQRWNGPNPPLSWFVETYGVDECFWTHELNTTLKAKGIKKLFTLLGDNTDSGNKTTHTATFEGIADYTVDSKTLHPILSELRVCKTPLEINYMRLVSIVTCQAHVYVMRHVKPGMAEIQLEAMFCAWTHYFAGSRHCAYTCICGTGNNGSILHYGHAGRPNNCILQDGDMMVLDMGGEYNGFATDMTRSYPANGKFTADQRAIYEAVRAAQNAVFAAAKPGVEWPKMHQLAERVIIEHLIKLGILANGTVDDMVKAHIGAVFMPHGLGHLMGLNVHDVGGYPTCGPARLSEPGVKYLRTARPLKEGMVITVEPGVYFNKPWIKKAMADPVQGKFIDAKTIERFWDFGGVRLEDDVLITADGIENWSAALPVTIEDIEEVITTARAP